MPITKVSHKFQVVIPKEIREFLDISKGDTLDVYGKDHEIIMKKIHLRKPLSLKSLKGLGKEIWKDVDIEEYINRERDSW
ncbi:MAG: AbrB/MazE/SpoVT family DNA-binding domain-containing protein [Candidatus Methanoperedens sp.]|nr:AbrB/MazE/SpoVT family DNA-binding domain-containing protein [Candidatus Methanoperedens sp.]MCE8426784.1 AbrB/MazE/SpoVT family DNA-binding domain-containing protein [Candidatus Methanoperedens sp.]